MDWNFRGITEMMKARNLGLVLGAALVLFAGSLASAAFVKGVPIADSTFNMTSGGVVLYTQLDDPSGSAWTDQDFEAIYAAYSSEGADDFVVGDAAGWDLTTLNTPGLQSGGGSPSFVNHFFYADGGGVPGAVLADCDFPGNASFTHNLGDIAADVTGCHTPAGSTWFSQSVRQDFVPFGQHYWATRLTAANTPAVFRNPGNGFGSGCLDWAPANSVCLMAGADFLFEVVGENPIPPTTPAVGPFGIALMVLGLGAGSAYVMRRRNA
jgi:hypothetical protein